MTHPPEYDVAIVGGGPVGMGLAIELGQRGKRVAVVERHETPQPIPKGQNLTQRTAEHFHFWGCEPELRAARTVPKDAGIGGITCYGTLLSDYNYDWLNRAKVGQYYYTRNERLPQYATEGVLRARAAELPEIDVFYGWDGVDFTEDASGVSVTAQARDGGTEQVIRAKYLAGCDGSRSVIRDAAEISETFSDHDRKMVLLVFKSTELHELVERYPGKAFFCVLHPDLNGYWLFFGRVDQGTTWFFHAPVPADSTVENYDFAALLHRAVGQEFAVEFEHIGFWDLRVAYANDYRKNRVFVAGDAAHSHPPYGGYGINTGFEDARNLGWKLAAVLDGWGGADLLNTYDSERRPVFASTARDFIERYIVEDREFLNRFNPATNLAEFETAWHSRNLDAPEVNAFEPNYEGSTIVCGAGFGAPSAQGNHSFVARAGHHLAPVRLADGQNPFDLLGAGFTLFCFGCDADLAERFRAAAADLGIPLKIVVQEDRDAAAIYRARAILVRPDQFIAWAGDESDAHLILNTATGRNGGI